MGKPSIFSNNYHRTMRRRKRLFRICFILTVFAVALAFYIKPAGSFLKKFAGELSMPIKIGNNQNSSNKNTSDNTIKDNSANNSKTDDKDVSKDEETVKENTGEIALNLSSNENISITYTKKDGNTILTGIKPDNMGITFDIRSDGKAVVFDDPLSSDIRIYNVDGTCKLLNPQTYKMSSGNGEVFYKSDVLKKYEGYVWASKPKFLPDGRILYQSNLPWFRTKNNYYLWVVDSDGKSSKWILGTDQGKPVEYDGFSQDGKIIVEYGGGKYKIDVNARTKEKLN